MGFGNFGDGGGISWTICKQSAPRCRPTPTPHHQSIFTGRMLFPTPNQQRQSTEGITVSPPQLTRAISRVKLFDVSVYEINDILKIRTNSGLYATGNKYTANDASRLRMSAISYMF